MGKKNQYKPLPPIHEIKPYIEKYWKMQWTDQQILDTLLAKHVDTSRYGLGYTRFREIRAQLGFLRTRQQAHTIEDIRTEVEALRTQFPRAGVQEMKNLLFHEQGIRVARSVITEYFCVYEPDLVVQRRANRLKRKRFWAGGVNDIWTVDQHDKWKYKFGLCKHICVEPVSGEIIWLKIWWTNTNPRLILSFYLDSVEELGFMPLVTQSDPGVENFGLANGHTLLRHDHDISLVGTLQHRWMNRKKNIVPEIGWSQLRRRWSPGFENLLQIGVDNEWYDSDNLLQSLVFRWIFIPWLQRELDAYRDRVNLTAKRADKNKILPHGVPNHIFESADDYGVLDFKIPIQHNSVKKVRQIYAPRDHEVFELVPPGFAELAIFFYDRLGGPAITRTTVWGVYNALLDCFENLDNAHHVPREIDVAWGYAFTMSRDDYTEELELLPNLEPLAEKAQSPLYVGGVNNGLGLSDEQSAQLDQMMERDLPLPHGMMDIVEEETMIVVFSSDEEASDEEEVEQLLQIW